MRDLDTSISGGARLADLLRSATIIQDNKGKKRKEGQRGPPAAARPQAGSDAPEKSVLDILDRHRDKKGNPTGIRGTKRNVYMVLRFDSRWRGRIWLNTFSGTLMLNEREYRDSDDVRISMWLDRTYELRGTGGGLASGTIAEIVQAIGEENEVNPLTEWLNTLRWDGKERIDRWLPIATGCQDDEIRRRMGRCWLIQAAARAYTPGCKADCVLILVGYQGAGKSSLFRVLASDQFFADTPLDIGSTNAYIQIRRAWIYEVAELDSVRRSANSATKAFLSAQEDVYRPPYGRRAITVPRHVVFAGTTNESQFISDGTGSRRYWPVVVRKVDLDWVQRHKEQLWAEAVHAFKTGENWWLDEGNETKLDECNSFFFQSDPWEELVYDYLRGVQTQPTTAQIMREALKLDASQMKRFGEMRVSELMRRFGYERKRISIRGKRKYVWARDGDLIDFKASGSDD